MNSLDQTLAANCIIYITTTLDIKVFSSTVEQDLFNSKQSVLGMLHCFKCLQKIQNWSFGFICYTPKHSSSLPDAEAYGRPKHLPSFLKSDMLPLSQLISGALFLNLLLLLWDGNKSTLNRFNLQPSDAGLKCHFTTLPVIPCPLRLLNSDT